MNVYRMLGHNAGTPEAQALAERLSSWHDAMVGHERSRRTACDEECPHADAAPLWQAAVETFGSRAEELRFLQSRSAASAIGREDADVRPAASWPPPRREADARPAASWPPPRPKAAREDDARTAASWPPPRPKAAREDDARTAASWPPPRPKAAREDRQ